MKIKVNKRIKGITIAAAALVLIIVVAVMFIIMRYTPAKEKMSGYTYYGIDRNTDKVFVIIDGELYPDTGIIYEGRYYLPQEFIADNINVGFYYDKESDAVLYSDSEYMYTYKKDENVYTDDTGKTYNTDYSVVVESEGKCYVNWEYVAEHTDCEYEYGNEPERINITLEREEKNYETHNYNMKDDKITLAWFQVSGVAGNSGIDNNIATASGVNVLAPTWYSVKDSSGNMSCYASAGLVNKMHQRGTDVWALVSDFDTNVDFAALYSSKKARTNMVNTLINDAEKYGFDGINLDCENIKSAYAKDYLQFVRELSIACERKGLVLSTDNYKPEAYNRCYNLKEQSRFVDYVIVMAYDEHYAGTDAGSVASLPFVKEAVEDTVQLVGKEHVIAGIPFYTRIWTTTDGNTTSRAVGMQAAVDQLNSDGQVALWNDDCGQYVASYTVGNATRQIWFEEEKSIEAKMQVIQENNVAGVAGWKLGLEKSSVWPVIRKYNK